MRIILPAALCVLLATPGMAQSVGEKSGVNSLVGVTPSTQDFVTEAAQSDMFEIQSSRLANQKASPAVKSFAAQMITDHTKTTSEVKSLVQSKAVRATLPTKMSSSQQSMLDKLRRLGGSDFDKQYGSDQVSAHKQAIDLFQRYAKGGTNARLKSFAASTLPILRHHLDMANSLPQ